MRSGLLEAISCRVLLCDGAMGTMLMKGGRSHGDCLEEWNVSRPETVERVHVAYFDAGCNIVLTNTLCASPIMLARHGFQDRVEQFNRNAVRVARRAAGPDCYVLGDIGPCGGLLAPYGDLKPEDVEESFFAQASALAAEDLDGLIIETMMDLEEAKLAVRAAKRATALPVIASMSFQAGKDVHRTIMGQKAADCAVALKQAGADVVGSNCGVGSTEMVGIIAEIAAARIGLPLLAKPNAGLPILKGTETIFPETPGEMADHMEQFLKLGVRILGGCCGTTPDHIRAFRRVLDHGRCDST